MPALSKHGGGEEARMCTQRCYSDSTKTNRRWSLFTRGPSPAAPTPHTHTHNLFHCKCMSLFLYFVLYRFLPSLFHIHPTTLNVVFLSGTQTPGEVDFGQPWQPCVLIPQWFCSVCRKDLHSRIMPRPKQANTHSTSNYFLTRCLLHFLTQ